MWDFTIQHVSLGTYGNPLVLIEDPILFPEYNYCMHLGGFSNLSFKEKDNRVAFDI